MTRIIIEKSVLTTGQQLLDALHAIVKFANANPALITGMITAKTAVSTVQADGTSAGGATEIASALSDFVTDVVAAGDYVTIIKSDEEANIGTWRVVSVTDLNTLVLDATLISDTAMSFTVDRVRHSRHSIDDINLFVLP